ncbi:MAG TPA: hypothetical protein VFZ91_04690 [Allosphingosinicella sp.]
MRKRITKQMADERKSGKVPTGGIGMHPDLMAALSSRAINLDDLATLAARAKGQVTANAAARGEITAREADDTLVAEAELKPAIAGGDTKKPTRSRRGKVTTRGRHRLMNHWEIFDSELNELGGLQKDAQRAYTVAAFLAALALDIFRDIATSDDMVGLARVFWLVLALAAAAGATKFFLDGRYYERRGGTRLQQIKDEHDDDE